MIPLLLALQAASLGATNYTVDVAMTAPTAKPTFADEFDKGIDPRLWRYDVARNRKGWATTKSNIMPRTGARMRGSRMARSSSRRGASGCRGRQTMAGRTIPPRG